MDSVFSSFRIMKAFVGTSSSSPFFCSSNEERRKAIHIHMEQESENRNAHLRIPESHSDFYLFMLFFDFVSFFCQDFCFFLFEQTTAINGTH